MSSEDMMETVILARIKSEQDENQVIKEISKDFIEVLEQDQMKSEIEIKQEIIYDPNK
jgi:hypothetical protein